MTFSVTRPPSPSREGHISGSGHDDDHLSSALHAAFSSFVPGSSAHPDPHHDMIKEKERAGIDIVVDSDCLVFRGTGVDVEPVLLKGHIALHLTEPTSIKEITLQFRGKAKLPQPAAETMPLSTSQQWYTICNHDWSFLEGEKRHSHTLKAGFHQFPFQLQLGGSLPSSITSVVHGGAHAIVPISIVRTFAAEALEYQQSLEIENTWPEKLMYSIMIPHKAWAAGDQLTAIVKFSPLSKGVRVLTVTTTIHETTKLHFRNGAQEHTSIVTVNHDIPNRSTERHSGSYGRSAAAVPIVPRPSSEARPQNMGSVDINQALTLRQVPSTASSHETHSTTAPPPSGDPSAFSAEPFAAMSTTEEEVPMSQNDVVAHLSLYIPKSITPSHPLEPITVFHRIRWSILMSNLDGHTSELRCSLPLHILDARLLDEARANSAATRRLLLEGHEAPVEEDQDAELPSYSAHVRDRVANMYLPDSVTTRVLNPWVHTNVSPIDRQSLSGDWSLPGTVSPFIPHPVSSHLPHAPQAETNTPLDCVDSELLHSQSNTVRTLSRADTSPHSHSPDPGSRPGSRPVSRRGSRPPSPDRHPTLVTTITPFPAPPITTSHETFVHDSHASRTLPRIFSIQMKPHTSLTSHAWLPSRSNSHSNLASLVDATHVHRAATWTARQSVSVTVPVPVPASGSQAATLTPAESVPESTLWHRAFIEVPDYDVASRGFMGGVTPLSSMRGLPSYEEAERCTNGAGGVDEEGRLTLRRSASGPERAA